MKEMMKKWLVEELEKDESRGEEFDRGEYEECCYEWLMREGVEFEEEEFSRVWDEVWKEVE